MGVSAIRHCSQFVCLDVLTTTAVFAASSLLKMPTAVVGETSSQTNSSFL